MLRSMVFTLRCSCCLLLTACLAVSCLLPTAWADPIPAKANDPEVRQVTLAVVSLLQREHLSGHDLDDEISQRCLGSFLKSLDPWKVYFYQSDVDGFLKHEKNLDDRARRGDITFAYTVFGTFLERIDERVKMIDELLAGELDFTADEKMLSDRDLAKYPQTATEALDRWRKRIKYDLLVLKADGTEGQEALDKLTRRYHSFSKRMHQTDSEELLEMYLTSISMSFDPHTSYMSPSTLKNFEIMMRLELEGIGASLQSVDGYVVVKKIIVGGAAAKEKSLKVEDKIVGVREAPESEMVDTVDMKLTDVVKMIRGNKGTVVELEVKSVDSPEKKLIKIVREKIELKDSEAHGEVFEDGRKPGGGSFKIGVIKLPSFYMDMEGARRGNPNFKSTTRDVRKILEDFKEQGVDAVVLDLRHNGGGSLTEAINTTGLFIDQGPVVQVKGRPGKDGRVRVRPYYDPSPGAVWPGPLVVLISKFSASASEILAGAVQDYQRGLIVGDATTHGKGTVQSLMDLGRQLFPVPNATKELGALKITMQQFYRPGGDSTQKHGVACDIELPSLTSHLDVGESDLDYPVEFDEVESLSFEHLGYVNQPLCDRLEELSRGRQSDSEDFQKVIKNIARYKEQKEKQYITLNEKKFLEERAEMNAEKEEQETIEKLNDPNQPAIRRDYYLNEAMAITVDFLNLRQVAKTN